jgi:hypothetical protein
MRQKTKESFTNFDIAGELLKLEIALKDLCDGMAQVEILKNESKLFIRQPRRKSDQSVMDATSNMFTVLCASKYRETELQTVLVVTPNF